MRHMLGKALMICALPFGAAAAGPHDPLATYMVEAIPFALKDGKSMDDMMALRDDFAKLSEAGDLEYSAYIMSPHFMSQSSLPVDEKFDAIWLGFSRNPSTLAASLSAYLESGAEMEQAFDEVREMNQRWLMRGELVHQSDAPEGDGPGYAFFSTCRLKDGASRMSHRAAEKAWSEAMEKVGASANSHIWYAGQGIPDALQGAMIKVRIFESVQAWGDSYTAFIENDMASSPEWAAMASQVDCGPIRSYLGRAFYERNAD